MISGSTASGYKSYMRLRLRHFGIAAVEVRFHPLSVGSINCDDLIAVGHDRWPTPHRQNCGTFGEEQRIQTGFRSRKLPPYDANDRIHRFRANPMLITSANT
jgi:hypothetical protein